MADHIYNNAGSTSVTPPSAIAVGDTLKFNVTNIDDETKYKGTLLTYTFPFDCKVKMGVAGAGGGLGNSTKYMYGKGASIQGTRDFKEGDTLLMLVGQAGTDVEGSVSDGVGGAGGGGTFVTLKVDTGGDIYKGAGVGNGWQVKPLIISAGGGGESDTKEYYFDDMYEMLNGVADEGEHPTDTGLSIIKNLIGGGYRQGLVNGNGCGQDFLDGGYGATYTYGRDGQISYAGFGGGSSNDDITPSCGGGYYGGFSYDEGIGKTFLSPATSYIDSSFSSVTREDGKNTTEGYVVLTFLEVSEPKPPKPTSEIYAKMNGVWIKVI